MKKTIIMLLMTLPVISTNAQFKVQSDGKIAIQTVNTALSPISINSSGSSNYYIHCNSSVGKSGLLLNVTGTDSVRVYGGEFNSSYGLRPVGLRGNASYSNNCIGMVGTAGCGTRAIGVLGDVQLCSYGAAVYGTTHGEWGSALTSGIYAGFFNGNVKVTGYIDGVLLGDESSGGSGSSVGSVSLRSASVTNSLSGLHATTYQKVRPAQPQSADFIDDLNGDTLQRGITSEPDVMEEQFYEKTHYALDADHLAEAFPDLVYVRADGSKAINYMEMIPLLVHSINELNAEIEQLKSQTRDKSANASRTATRNTDFSISNNVLYQNTPNPFKEQTTIRFTLADDARDASVCIFDMTGKLLRRLPVSSDETSVSINGWELGEGMFLYSLMVNGREIDTKRMIISK